MIGKSKNLRIVGFLSIILLFSAIILAANDEEKEVDPPPWMEDVKVKGRSTYLVPKGAKREVIGAQVVIEPPSEYVARRIYEIEQHFEAQFTQIKKNQKVFKREIERLQKALGKVKKEQKIQEEKINQKIRFLNNER